MSDGPLARLKAQMNVEVEGIHDELQVHADRLTRLEAAVKDLRFLVQDSPPRKRQGRSKRNR